MTMSNMKTQNNRGVTLIELLVVVAILAIMTGTVVIGVGLVNSGNAQKTAKLLSVNVNDVRTSTMSIENDWSARLQKKDDKYYVVVDKDGTDMETTNLGGRVKITYNNGTADKSIENGNELVFKFNKATGRVKTITYGLIGADEASVEEVKDTSIAESMTITVTGSSGLTDTLRMWYETGKITEE